MEDYLEIRQAGEPDQEFANLTRTSGSWFKCEITALVGSSRIAGQLWHFLNAAATNLIQSCLYQHDPEVGAVSIGAIDEGDL